MDFIRSFIEGYLPPNYSAHGHHVDNLIIWTHYLMFVLFVGWGIYFIYTLFKFRASNNSKANYEGVKSHYSTYIEFGVILFEAFLIFALALPKWQDLKLNIEKPKNVPIAASVIDRIFISFLKTYVFRFFSESKTFTPPPRACPMNRDPGLNRVKTIIGEIITLICNLHVNQF